MGLLKILFLVNFISLLFGEVIRVQVFSIEARLLDITSAILFAYWIFYCVMIRKLSKIIIHPMLLFIIFAFMSLVLNLSKLSLDQFTVSLLYLLRWVVYAGIFSIVLSFDKNFKNLIKKALLFIGAIIVMLGYIQYFFYNDLGNLYYLGWDEHLYRLFSVFLDPNFAGIFFVLYLIFLLDYILKNIKNKFNSFILSVVLFAAIGSIFLTYSRSAVLTMLVGILLYLVLKKKVKYIFLLILGTLMITSFLPRAYKTEGTNFIRTASSEARISSYLQGISIFKENPIYGVGFNAYRFAKDRNLQIKAKTNIGSHADSSNDNSFLFVLATTGVIGFSFFVLMWYKLLNIYGKSPMVIASVIALFVNSLFINSLFYTPILFWIWTVMAVRENK